MTSKFPGNQVSFVCHVLGKIHPHPLTLPTILPLKWLEWKFSKCITEFIISNTKNIWVTNFIRTIILSNAPSVCHAHRPTFEGLGEFYKMMVRIKFVTQMFLGLLIFNPVIHFENFHSHLFSGSMVEWGIGVGVCKGNGRRLNFIPRGLRGHWFWTRSYIF